MRLVRNPSHKHSEEIIKKFNLLKDNIFYKDHTSYEPEQIKSFIKIVELCKSFGLKSESTKWVSKQVVDLKLDEKAVNEDYIPILLGYQKYKNKGLKQLSEYVSVIELNYAIQEIVGETSEAVSSEEFGIIDEHNGWLLTMPYTLEASCSLGSNTVWCTARRDNENRFFDYVFGSKAILFYAVNLDKSVKKERKISIGFKNGVLITGASETVDENNNTLSEADLIRIFNKETYERFHSKMKEKIQLMNNEHPLITKIKSAKNNINKFNTLTNQEKKEVLNLGGYSHEFESYIYDIYFANAKKTIFLSDLMVSFLSNVSNVEIVKKIYDNEHLMHKQKSYMFSSKHVPEFIRKDLPEHFHNIEYLRDSDFICNVFSYVDYKALDEIAKERLLDIVSAQKFDSPSIENILFDEQIFDFAKKIKIKSPDSEIFENLIMRTFSKKIITSVIDDIRKHKYFYLYHLSNNSMFDEFKIDLINALDLHEEKPYRFLDKMIEINKINSDDYPQIRDNIIRFNIETNGGRYSYESYYVKNIKNLVLKNEKDPLVKKRFFIEHSDIDYFTDEELLFIFNKKGKYDPFNKELEYSLFLRLHKLFPKEAVLYSILLCQNNSGVKNIRTDNIILKEAIRKIIREREDRRIMRQEDHFEYINCVLRSTIVDKSLLMDLIRADIQQYIMYAKEIEGLALKFIFKNLDIFLNDKFLRAAVELEGFMRSKNFKPEFLLEIDNRKIKNFYMHNGQNSLMMLASFEIFSYPASREAIISHAITQGITTEEEIQRIINSKKKSLDQMAKSKNLNDLLYVASQKNLTKSIIETLKASRRKEVLDALLDNPDIYLSDLF